MRTYYFIHPFIGILFLAGFQVEMNLANSQGKSSARISDSHFRFEHLTVDDGLPQNEIVCIYQDRAGFMWFGTKGGLARYDGYGFKTYHAEPWRDSALSNSSITVLFELDRKQTPDFGPKFQGLWIGTDGGGLNIANSLTHKFAHFLDHENDTIATGRGNLSTIMQDRRGIVWIATLDGLYRFDLKSQAFVSVDYDNVPHHPGRVDQILSLCEDRTGAIWIGTNHGAYRYEPERNSFVRFGHDDHQRASISADLVQALYQDSHGRVWFGTQGGLDRYDDSTQTISHVLMHREGSIVPTSNSIVTICEDSRGFLWVGTVGGGVGMFDPRAETWEWANHVPDDPSSLSDNTVFSITEDFTGTMWFGTRRGVNKMTLGGIRFGNYRSITSTRNNIVWSICESTVDSLPIVFVGTQAGLATLDQPMAQLKPFTPEVKGIEVLNRYAVRSILADHSEVLWIGTLGGGLFRFDRKRGVIEQRIDRKFKMDIYALLDDGKGNLWVGTNGSGLLRYDKANGTFEDFSSKSPDDWKENEWVIAMQRTRDEGSDSVLWVGTWSYGLARVDLRTRRRTYFQHERGNSNTLSDNSVFSLYESAREPGILWIGTGGGGLSRLNIRDTTFTTFTRQHDLPDNVVYGILEDGSGALWLSTNSGLSRFDPRKGEFRNYDHSDGLQSNEFNLGAYFKNDRGELFFGGPNGLNGFVPDLVVNSRPPRVVLTHLAYPGSDSRAPWEGNSSGIIELSYDKGFLSFEFVALHYKEPSKNRYAYMLTGADKEWRYANARSEPSYTALPPGEYAFVVKAANCDGAWSTPRTMATIVIAPPFWARWWFYTLCVAFLVGSAFLFHRSSVRRAVRMERAMADGREQLRKKLAADFHDEIGHKLTAISLGARLLERELATAAVHVRDQVTSIGAHVDQVSKEVRELTWELDPDKDSLLDLAEYLKGISDQLFDTTDIAFRIVGLENHFGTVKLPIEWRRQLTRIFKEAMHNVAKHAKGCRNVTLAITLRDRLLTIALTDDGSGFETTGVSAGNGFANMRNRSVFLNGSLDIVSKAFGGTAIHFESKLP